MKTSYKHFAAENESWGKLVLIYRFVERTQEIKGEDVVVEASDVLSSFVRLPWGMESDVLQQELDAYHQAIPPNGGYTGSWYMWLRERGIREDLKLNERYRQPRRTGEHLAGKISLQQVAAEINPDFFRLPH
jgi:hypothetical protein